MNTIEEIFKINNEERAVLVFNLKQLYNYLSFIVKRINILIIDIK